MTSIWDSIEPGTIVDADIARLAEAGELVIDQFDPKSVRQGCYELRASSLFYETWASEENRRIDVGVGGSYFLRPKTFVTAIVLESIRLPDSVLARILTKGQLFSIGVLPVNTYADPGFEGQLGITLCNMSNRYIRISPGLAIAKIEFTKLWKPVAHPYSGQHGYQTGIWPIPNDLFASRSELFPKARYQSAVDELELSYGADVADMERRLRYYEHVVWLQIAVTVGGFGLLFALVGYVTPVVAIGLGVLTNLLTTIGVNSYLRLRRRLAI